jgi:DEAD/DEAH box helicase domain-containing protein
MVVRNLLQRVGLSPDSDKVRFIATSASMTDMEVGKSFAADFFGANRESFQITSGTPRQIPEVAKFDVDHVLNNAVTVDQMSSAVVNACKDDSGAYKAKTISEISKNLFGEDNRGESVLADILIRFAESKDETLNRLRGHIFFRTPRGIWACLNPKCEGAKEYEYEGRTLGKLFDIPTVCCDVCSSRVLELLYCFDCGDVSLGGFVSSSDPVEFGDPQTYLSSLSRSEPDNSGKEIAEQRSSRDFVWITPNPEINATGWNQKFEDPSRGVTKTFRFEFAPARIHSLTGFYDTNTDLEDGFIQVVRFGHDQPAESDRNYPALPLKCPSCAAEGYVKSASTFWNQHKLRSPIRAHTTGQSIAIQVMLSQLVRSLRIPVLGEKQSSKTIVFTDSVADASGTAAGVAFNNHFDLLRQIFTRKLYEEHVESPERIQMEIDHLRDLLSRGEFTGKYWKHELDSSYRRCS